MLIAYYDNNYECILIIAKDFEICILKLLLKLNIKLWMNRCNIYFKFKRPNLELSNVGL